MALNSKNIISHITDIQVEGVTDDCNQGTAIEAPGSGLGI